MEAFKRACTTAQDTVGAKSEVFWTVYMCVFCHRWQIFWEKMRKILEV